MSTSVIPRCGVLFVSTRIYLSKHTLAELASDYRSLAFLTSPILQHSCNSVIGLTGLFDATMPLDHCVILFLHPYGDHPSISEAV